MSTQRASCPQQTRGPIPDSSESLTQAIKGTFQTQDGANGTLRDEVYYSDRIARLPEVLAATGLSRDTVYRYIREGRFPKQRRITDRASGWLWSSVQDWIKSRPAV